MVLRTECLKDISQTQEGRCKAEGHTPSWHTSALKLKPNSGWPCIQLGNSENGALNTEYAAGALDSIATVARARSDGTVGVDLGEVLQDVLPASLEVCELLMRKYGLFLMADYTDQQTAFLPNPQR